LDTDDFPVEQVSWEDAQAFLKRLSALPAEVKTGRTYRLPTEAEWEYACRAGTSAPFHFGNSLSSTQANFDGNHPYGGAATEPYLERTTRVGSYKPNALGLYDMHGNVWEWCNDWFAEDYYQESPRRDPSGPSDRAGPGGDRVLRGGGWEDDGQDCRSASRGRHSPGDRNCVVGLRAVLVVHQSSVVG
jgi:formylglycine-generating enzyme required for sulfatase activity